MARKSRRNVEAATPKAVKPIFRVGAYVRLSSVDKKQKGDSIENQQAIIGAYIAEHSDLELTDTYIDNGLSGQTLERPAFQRMLADLESGKINCCVTKDLSRLGRNAIDMGYYIEKFFPTRNIRYIAVNDDYDSSDANSGGIMVGLKNMVNEAYALDIGRKIRATKQMNIRNGCFVGRFPPYGYLKSKADGHKLEADDYAADIVSRMFDMAAGGQGVRAILQWLNGDGILPPRRYFQSIGLANGKESSGQIHWNKTVIYSILKNRVYVGDMVQGKNKVVDHIEIVLPKSEWVITENTHEGIVSRELFARVQALYPGDGKTRASSKSDNIFLRKIFCGHCGHAMRRVNYRQSHGFRCTTRQDYSKDDCTLVSINENAVKEALLETLRKQATVFSDNTPATTVKSLDNTELRDVQAELGRNSHFLKGLYESLICGDITDTEYKDMKQSYGAKIASLTERERKLREASRLSALEVAARSKTSDSIGAVCCVANLTAEVIDTLVEKIRVFEDKSIEIRFKFTDEVFTIGGMDNE